MRGGMGRGRAWARVHIWSHPAPPYFEGVAQPVRELRSVHQQPARVIRKLERADSRGCVVGASRPWECLSTLAIPRRVREHTSDPTGRSPKLTRGCSLELLAEAPSSGVEQARGQQLEQTNTSGACGPPLPPRVGAAWARRATSGPGPLVGRAAVCGCYFCL